MDVPPHDRRERQSEPRDRRHRLTALVDDRDAARELVERLSLAGIDGSDIVVVDPGRAQPPSRERDRRTDARVMARLARRGAVGAFIGLVAAVALLLVVGIVLDEAVSWWWVTGGLGLGAAVGLVSTPVMAPAWEAANTPGPGVRRVVIDDLDDRSLQRVRTVIGDLPRELTVD